MPDAFFEEPLRTTVVGLFVDVFGSEDALKKISRPLPHDKAQEIAKLIHDDLRAKMGVAEISLVMAGGLLDTEHLDDEEHGIITALEHGAEQFMAVYPDVESVAMTGDNDGLESIGFPTIEPENPEDLNQLAFCLPLAVVGYYDDLDRFEEVLFKEDPPQMQFTSDAVVLALTEAYGLEPGELMAIGYGDLDDAEEYLGAYTTNAKMTNIGYALKSGRQMVTHIKGIPVFAVDGRPRAAFFSFDAFARRLPHLTAGGQVETAYEDFVRDYRFVVAQLEEEGFSPWCINFPSQGLQTDWESVLAAPRLDGGIFVEEGAPGLFSPGEGPAAGLDMVCFTDDEGAMIAATLMTLNEDDEPMRQTNIYAMTYDGADAVFEYAKAVAQRTGLHLDVSSGDGIYIDPQRRALCMPPLEKSSYLEPPAPHLLH